MTSSPVTVFATRPPSGMSVLGVPRHRLAPICGVDGIAQVFSAPDPKRALQKLGAAAEQATQDLRTSDVDPTPERVLTVVAHREPGLVQMAPAPDAQPSPKRPLGALGRGARGWLRARWRGAPPPGPQISLGRDPLEIHSLVCTGDVSMSLWSLASFVATTGLRPRIVIHDDGSLTPADRAVYARHFEGIEILDPRAMDQRMAQELASWPACAEFRARPDFYCGRKLFDILFAARRPKLLVLDSDVLLLREPQDLVCHLRAGTPCFGSDYQSSYGMRHADLSAWRGRPVLPCVNAGVLHIPVEGYLGQLDLVERYLQHAIDHLPPGQPNQHEQTAHALLMSELGGERLPLTYQVAGRIDDHTHVHHFVRDGRQRERFWRRGVRRLRAQISGRLAEIAQQDDGNAALRPVQGFLSENA